MGKIDEIEKDDMTQKHFYQDYLTKSKPFHLTDGCEHWPGIYKWNDQDYLVK